MDRGECFLRCGFPVTKRWRTGISIWQLLSFECLGKTDLCAATMAKSYESKLENRIVHTERLRSLGAKSPTFFHPSVFTIRKRGKRETLCMPALRGVSKLLSFYRKWSFCAGSVALKETLGGTWSDSTFFSRAFSLALTGAFFCLITSVLRVSRKPGNLFKLCLSRHRESPFSLVLGEHGRFAYTSRECEVSPWLYLSSRGGDSALTLPFFPVAICAFLGSVLRYCSSCPVQHGYFFAALLLALFLCCFIFPRGDSNLSNNTKTT